MIEDHRIRAATFLRVHDGDTFWSRVDLTPGMSVRVPLECKIRVRGYNAAELSETEGPLMRDLFETRLKATVALRVKLGRMSYDRVVCDVWMDGSLFSGVLQTALRGIRAKARKMTDKQTEARLP